ncbi:MAG TPA: MarR family transcriptional regulator [Puia sp.]
MAKPNPNFSIKEAEDSSGFLLWQVTTLWQRGIKKALDTIEITHPQFVLLASLLWLSGQKKSVTQIDLSQHSQIDPMTTSTVIRTLQKKGLVERREHETDTRAKIVLLTANGLKVTRKAVKIIENFDADFFQSLGDKADAFNIALRLLLRPGLA